MNRKFCILYTPKEVTVLALVLCVCVEVWNLVFSYPVSICKTNNETLKDNIQKEHFKRTDRNNSKVQKFDEEFQQISLNQSTKR